MARWEWTGGEDYGEGEEGKGKGKGRKRGKLGDSTLVLGDRRPCMLVRSLPLSNQTI